jgi:ribonucleoside-diphosphate reductase subunit M1
MADTPSTPQELYVVKRDGRHESVKMDKVTDRLKKLCNSLSNRVDPVRIALKVVGGIYSGVTTAELDNLAAEEAACITDHPDYAILAGRIAASNLQKVRREHTFSSNIALMHGHVDHGRRAPLVADRVAEVVAANAERLDAAIRPERDMEYHLFGFRTLERSYLLRVGGQVAETPQWMWMRVAVGIHLDDIDSAIETYDLMSTRFFTHASPTLFNAGTPHPQLSSCFLVAMKDDSIEGIYDTLKDCALISKSAGGVGMHIHNVRARSSYIRGTNGTSNGIIPMLRVFNATARYVDQGGGKRPGAMAVYLEPWHADVRDWVELRVPTGGTEETRCRDLFLALWVPDLFMRRVEADAEWSLMCPMECPGLADVFGDAFDELYERYEREGRAKATIKARDLWNRIVDAQIKSGAPYILYKDAANRKSNQMNMGVIKSSNLCTEIMEVSTPEETAVCNLASICLPRFVGRHNRMDFEQLQRVVHVIVRNLNKIIDCNAYPIPEARASNMRGRPIGIGVQGLADVFQMQGIPFDGFEARELNKQIFEVIYYAALDESCRLAEATGAYPAFAGSPASRGVLQFDMWDGVSGPSHELALPWDALRERIKAHGLRNSLLLAPMPTASTSQIMRNTEACEPCTSNLYVRRVTAGEFIVCNPHLVRALEQRHLWTESIRKKILANNGSVQSIEAIPKDVREVFRTVWEIPQRSIIDMAADRGAFIDQSQSMNLHLSAPTPEQVTSMQFYAWKKGLKTGQYYLRTRPAANAIQFTVEKDAPSPACARGGGEQQQDCEMCSS